MKLIDISSILTSYLPIDDFTTASLLPSSTFYNFERGLFQDTINGITNTLPSFLKISDFNNI